MQQWLEKKNQSNIEQFFFFCSNRRMVSEQNSIHDFQYFVFKSLYLSSWSSDSACEERVARPKCSSVSSWRIVQNLKVYQSEKLLPCVSPHLNHFGIQKTHTKHKNMHVCYKLHEFLKQKFENFQNAWRKNDGILSIILNIVETMQLCCIHWTMNNEPIWANNGFGYQLKSEETHLSKERLLFTFRQRTYTLKHANVLSVNSFVGEKFRISHMCVLNDLQIGDSSHRYAAYRTPISLEVEKSVVQLYYVVRDWWTQGFRMDEEYFEKYTDRQLPSIYSRE